MTHLSAPGRLGLLPSRIRVIEVGPREGFQFEGIGRPDRFSLQDKIRLIDRLASTGIRDIQVASFVSRRAVPQMADAEQLCAALPADRPIEWTGIYLNAAGLSRALETPRVSVLGELTLSASEAFALRNQRRDFAQDLAAQKEIAQVYREKGIVAEQANIMAAFGCNFSGEVATSRVIERLRELEKIAESTGGALRLISLADTMGWGDPRSVQALLGAVRQRWPSAVLRLHLHDTRGLAVANAYAGLLSGVTEFEAAVGGLGGCPFAGHATAAGNIATEELLFLCDRLGIETGVSLEAMVEAAALASEIVGHGLPSKLAGRR